MHAGTRACARASARADTPRRSIAPRRTRHKPRASVPIDHIAFRSPNKGGGRRRVLDGVQLRVAIVVVRHTTKSFVALREKLMCKPLHGLASALPRECIRLQELALKTRDRVFCPLPSRFLAHPSAR